MLLLIATLIEYFFLFDYTLHFSAVCFGQFFSTMSIKTKFATNMQVWIWQFKTKTKTLTSETESKTETQIFKSQNQDQGEGQMKHNSIGMTSV